MRESDNLDELLRASLQTASLPSEQLNDQVRLAIAGKAQKQRELSIWWLPMLICILMSCSVTLLSCLFIPIQILQLFIISTCILITLAVTALTGIGLKFFELKKGALL